MKEYVPSEEIPGTKALANEIMALLSLNDLSVDKAPVISF